ncbi:spectrin beta chain, non-erythrocytic 1 isoform X7 [Astyanax mexicanus]|uniref:spectrin beta chain, non-erythrocytic 1 isoform X7 n=1 Tax=Astyanax mexicanus TaxID=7994 RepID=UPI0020CB4E24|nr:spectrin beta chain, non-erythrocytic 1 isoform X7 [Astyanax mexicanus]
MTESIVRKIQPFTIGTKLSAPAGPRSPLLPTDCAPALTLNNRAHPRSLGQQVSVCSRPGQSTDQYRRPADHPHHEHRAREDHLNRNQLSPNTTSRSARKITISNRLELSRTRAFLQTHNSEKNINNNNNNNNNTSSSCTAPTLLPRIERVHCEKQPKPKTAESKSRLPKEDIMRNSPPCSHPEVSVVSKVLAVQNDCCYTQQNAIFSQELSQAEAWIHRKLKFLRDSSNMQRRSLAEWEEISQTLQRDLKDFENTFIQLHQMGEKLICKRNPESDLVKKNLIQLKDLWSSLKQTADSQIKAAGEAQNVQEFNKKVDQLETWIKQKEEKQSLAGLLGENIDKLQLTRRILDLKQDEQLYRSLLEDINNLALKLEKQGKSESKNISTRRKHINKMWLKVQSNLKDCLENLHLALEVSSFYQQADNIIFSINNMRKGLSVNKRAKVSGDGEIRGIASQIMMLDVTVSQLSKLHLALSTRVSQKQAEVKDSWLLLQNTVRNEKAVHLHLTTREDCDLPTLNQEPRKTVGTDSHRIMGKGMKEEQNHLKGITEKNTRLSPNSQKEPQPDPGESLGCMCPRDSMANFQTKSGTPSKPSSFPQFYTQLQKFTVSADKTLSWLKDSVTMATNVCSSMEEPGSYEVAKKYQASLEKDILSNKDRIELVKKEGHSLVRAQHPGSTKIQEFLSQLEVLWEELNRRHQKNGVVLCAAEELNRKVVRVLQRLGSLEAWLEAVELSIKQVSLAGDPESVSVAERESSLLEKELETHGQELPSLRQEIEALCCQSHCHAQLLYTRMEDIDKKFSRVQMALTQQSSELKDTRMLTEFLERVELEENHYNTLGQPLKSDLDCEPTLLPRAGSADSELVECLVDPVEELREAVEMLNDTARERGRCQEHDHCIRELLKRHSTIAIRVEECLQHCAELAIDILEMENKMAVRCEPERCGLASLQEQQDQLKVHYNALEEEVKVMESLSAQLAVLCPERLHALKIEVETSLQAWEELGRSMAENQRRLLQFSHLRHFFRSYLEMISWTEDTRSRIFSESALCEDRESHGSIVEHLDQQIELKFKDFDLLAAAGAKLLSEDHHLAKMIKERMEELRSMLGWILVHWRVQRDQWLNRKRSEEPHTDDIYSEALVPLLESETLSEQPKRTEDSTTVIPGGLKDRKQLDDGYEVMESICPKDSESQPASEQVHSPNLELKEQNTPSLGGTVNLILSFSNSGDNQLQLQEPDHEKVEELPEDVHRPPKPHNSVCKSFWKRCQGLLGSLKRKKKFYQHSAEEDTSMSLLSVHMDLMGAATEISNPNTREQTTTSPESGRQEFPSMEGTLERKHKLLLGGRRAPSRAWSSCHAVLYRRTLSFYQDRKDTIRSSVTSLPLSLVGAECMPAPEYTKKPNCFSLRLRDGSEYLLSASSLFLMKTWILRIQANADSLGDLMEHKLQSQSPSAVPSSSSSKQDCTTSKRRSYSFTSATYQQIKPCALPPSGTIQNDNTTYSVTVFIGDGEKLAACSSAALPQPSACRPQFSQLPLRGYASLPPPQHKHTLRKFFGKE